MINYLVDSQARSGLADITSQWQTWVPTFSWSNPAPIGLTATAKYKVIGKLCFFSVGVSITDGNGLTTSSVYMTLHIAPKNNNIMPSVTSIYLIGSGVYNKYGYIRDNGTNNDVVFYVQSTNAGQSSRFNVSGFYEID